MTNIREVESFQKKNLTNTFEMNLLRNVRVDRIGDTEDWAFLRGKDEMMSLDDGEFSPP